MYTCRSDLVLERNISGGGATAPRLFRADGLFLDEALSRPRAPLSRLSSSSASEGWLTLERPEIARGVPKSPPQPILEYAKVAPGAAAPEIEPPEEERARIDPEIALPEAERARADAPEKNPTAGAEGQKL